MTTAAAKLALTAIAFITPALSAHAGDISAAISEPELAAPVVPPAANSIWSGFWIGTSLGRGSSGYDINAKVVETADETVLGALDLPDLGGKGGLLGAEIGWGHEFGNGWVAGAQLDYTSTQIETDASLVIGTLGAISTTFRPQFIASSLLRLGYLVSDSTMIYGLAGESYSTFHGNAEASFNADVADATYGFGVYGATIGAGVETRLGEKTSLKLEYRATDFGEVGLISGPITSEVNFDAAMATSAQSVRATLALHF
jgi:outer membrane immunogenic protein